MTADRYLAARRQVQRAVGLLEPSAGETFDSARSRVLDLLAVVEELLLDRAAATVLGRAA